MLARTPQRRRARRRTAQRRSRHRAAVRRDPRGEAGRRTDPLRGRARTAWCPISSASCRAAACGSRPTGPRSRTPSRATSSRAASSARSASRRTWSTQTERLLVRAALDALAIAGKAGLVAAGFAKVEAAIARDAIVGLIHAIGCRRRRRRQARRRAAAAGRRRRGSRSSRLSRRPNWIWHWAGQMWYMQPCLPGLQMTRFWRVLRALSAFGPASTGQGGTGRERN